MLSLHLKHLHHNYLSNIWTKVDIGINPCKNDYYSNHFCWLDARTSMLFSVLVILHILAATVWTGGQLLLNLRVLPDALKEKSVAQVRSFEKMFEPLRVTSLAIQVISGLWLTWIYLPGGRGLFSFQTPITSLLTTKLILLAIAFALALHAQIRLIPNLNDDNLIELSWHIRSITTVSIAFVIVGAGIRLGGF